MTFPPPPGPPRRRFVALCVVAFMALVIGIAVGAGGGSEQPKSKLAATKPSAKVVAKAKGLSLRRQVGEVLMIAFPGPSAPEYVRRALRQGRASGVILFHGNATSPSVTRALTKQLRRSSGNRALIAV